MTTTQAHPTTSTKAPPVVANGAVLEASLVYLTHANQKPVGYNPPPGSGLPERKGDYAPFPVPIFDARAIAHDLSLDAQGFVLVGEATKVTDFLDPAQIKDVYHPEVARLVRRATGARKAVIFDHTVRAADNALARGLRTPVHMVHNDYTEDSAPRRVRDLLPPEEAEARLKRRFIEVNVWRPIKGPVLSEPLGLVDARTIAPVDLVKADLVYADRKGEIYYGSYNPAHRWYYVPRMTTEEAVIIKCYDSAKDGRARFSLHSAFPDPTTPEGAPPRESIEVRVFAFF
jgi:hypothetical protein